MNPIADVKATESAKRDKILKKLRRLRRSGPDLIERATDNDRGPLLRPFRFRNGRQRSLGRLTTTTITNGPTRDDPARPLLVNVAQAPKILAISRSSDYQLIWNEQLTPVRIGRSVRFSIAQLEQFVTDRIGETRV